MKKIKTFLSASIITLSLTTITYAEKSMEPMVKTQLAQAVTSEHRSAANKARDEYRHPQQTLEFFGLKSTMTVVEITPGGGWYTEILAPALKGKGKLIGAHYPDTGEDNYYSNSRKKLVKKLENFIEFNGRLETVAKSVLLLFRAMGYTSVFTGKRFTAEACLLEFVVVCVKVKNFGVV